MRKKVSVYHWCLSSFFPLLKAAVAFLRAFLTSLFYLNLAPKDRLRAGKSFAEEEDDKDHLQESFFPDEIGHRYIYRHVDLAS